MEVALNKELILNKTACRLFLVTVFVALTSLGAFVRIPLPFSPVPITLQTFFVLLSASFLGLSLGMVAQLIYILLGLAGLSVFAQTASSLLYLFGPTAGYLFGFILATLFVGSFIKYARHSFFLVTLVFCLSDILLLSCGTLWLKFAFGFPLIKSLLLGFIPFIPGDLLKISLAVPIYLKFNSRVKEILGN
ncbi:MAG: biotin transporter BioY [Candidatus Omnitrophica bacterium]|nr:biotin transporter BioY [Candidatus Omnitrophota bacterium]